MSVTFTYSGNSMSLDFGGQTVGQVRGNSALASLLNLQGNESVEVRTAGSDSWETVDNDFELDDGDSVRFSRQTGTKG